MTNVPNSAKSGLNRDTIKENESVPNLVERFEEALKNSKFGVQKQMQAQAKQDKNAVTKPQTIQSAQTPGMSAQTPGMSTQTLGMSSQTQGMSTQTPGMSTQTSGMSTETLGMSTQTSIKRPFD